MTVAIGFFDGVHLGHQAILKDAELALTFENHPLSLLAPERAPRMIMSWEERAKTIQALGVHVIAFKFDSKIANLSPVAFLDRLQTYATEWSNKLRLPAGPVRIRAGANWHFGKGGVGDAKLAREHGIEVTIVPYAEYKSEPISSTRIRTALAAGEVEDANAMLGRKLKKEGKVFKGKGAGVQLGFPTINIQERSDDKVRLPCGVYEVVFQGMKAIANYGLAPTYAEKAWTEPTWEIHVVGAKVGDVQEGKTENFEVVRFLRPERKFASIENLQRQITIDCGIINL